MVFGAEVCVGLLQLTGWRVGDIGCFNGAKRGVFIGRHFTPALPG